MLKPAILKFVIALCFSALAACSDPPPPVTPPVAEQERIMPLHPDYSHLRCKPSVHPFWKKFRDAVLAEDWETVTGLTEFPLTIHRLDGDEKLIAREEFTRQFPQFLNATPEEDYRGVKSKFASMRDLIRATPTLDKKACGDFEILLSIEQWQFWWDTKGWRFGRIDVPEFPASMKHIPIQPLQIIKD